MQFEKNPSIKIRALKVQDILAVGYIHMQAFPESALTYMGFKTVLRYYQWLQRGPYQGYRTGVFDHEQLIGYCFAGMFRGSEIDFIINNWKFFLWRLLTHPWLLFKGRIRSRVWYGLKAVKKYSLKKKSTTLRSVIPRFGILAIAVSPSQQSKGAGRLLMIHAEEQARRANYSSMRLTVHPQNNRAVAFYEQLGWQRKKVDGGWNGLMIKELSHSQIWKIPGRYFQH